MIKIKLTSMGGYVVGDGPCPFDPDEFMKAFSHKLAYMRTRGLTELGISQEEIDNFITLSDAKIETELARASLIEIAQSRKATPEQVKQRIFGALDQLEDAAMAQAVIEQMDRPQIIAPQ